VNPVVELRTELRASDRSRIREIVHATGMFHPPEVDVAVELVDDRLAKGTASDYAFLLADAGTCTLGYACYGWNSMTQSSWDLYWIAVDPAAHGRGVGRRLLSAVEHDVRGRRGSRLWVETSGRAQYQPTRAFYVAAGYTIAAELTDFYAPGDSKVIFVKVF
jgi:ribosomal protein S18 acetylase RimI-like enzyme